MAPLQTTTLSGKPLDLTELFSKGSFTGSNGVTLNYRYLLPKDYDEIKKYPLIMMMHGAGEIETDNKKQLQNFSEAFRDEDSPIYDCIVIAPQCPTGKKWVSVPTWHNFTIDEFPETAEIQTAVELFLDMQKRYRVDTDRVYATGLSMGGFATWDMAVRHPELFVAIAPLCGGGDPTGAAQRLVDLPIWTFHGDADPTVPFSNTESLVNALRAAGNTRVKFDVMNGYAHNIWHPVYARIELFDWLLSHKRA